MHEHLFLQHPAMFRVPGFYWIRIDGQAPEVAFWDRDAHGWVLSGTDEVWS